MTAIAPVVVTLYNKTLIRRDGRTSRVGSCDRSESTETNAGAP